MEIKDNTPEFVLKAEAKWESKGNKPLVRHSLEWSSMVSDYNSKTMRIDWPAVGSNRRFVVYCESNPYAGFDDFEAAKTVATAYKKPGNPKRPENNNERLAWTVKDNSTGATVFTASPYRKNRD